MDIEGIDIYPYFSNSCYCGFGEDEDGFYAVYRHVFEKLEGEDKEFSAYNAEINYPTFGHSSSEEAEWQQFYAFFMVYATPRTYSWLDKYDIRQAENRRVSRLMEKENKKTLKLPDQPLSHYPRREEKSESRDVPSTSSKGSTETSLRMENDEFYAPIFWIVLELCLWPLKNAIFRSFLIDH